MDNVKYHSVLPENDISGGFTELNNVDFILTTDMARSLLLGSVRIEGDLIVYQTGTTPVADATRITMDNHVGMHSVIESISCVFNSGQVENIDNYGRFVKMISTSTSSEDDLHRSSALCELRSPNVRHTEYLIKQKNTKSTNSNLAINPDFSISPKFCLNRALQGSTIPFSKTGNIRVQIKLARNVAVLFGANAGQGATADPSYLLQNLRLTFKSVPSQPEDGAVLNKVFSSNQSLESNNASISTSAPGVVSAVSVTFMKQTQENTFNSNNFLLERPSINNIQMNYNDTSNAFQTFRLDNQQEIITNYLLSMRSAGIHDAKLNKLDSNDCFGAGIDFADNIDFSAGNKFSMVVDSNDIDNSNKVVIFLYFHSSISV
tara:strand:- start:76 stop:1203 length:1128 start_codon:yes stop_codon:yes gene_type:complete